MSQQVIPFETNRIMSRELKSGQVVNRLLSAKAYKEETGLKGREAKRAYLEYVRSCGTKANQNISAALASGEWVVTEVKANPRSGVRNVKMEPAAKYQDPGDILRQNDALSGRLNEAMAMIEDLKAQIEQA